MRRTPFSPGRTLLSYDADFEGYPPSSAGGPVEGTANVKPRQLGRMGLEVSPLGLGSMSMSEFYGASDEREAIATLHRAIELGVSFLDTADVYGQGHNEELIARPSPAVETRSCSRPSSASCASPMEASWA